VIDVRLMTSIRCTSLFARAPLSRRLAARAFASRVIIAVGAQGSRLRYVGRQVERRARVSGVAGAQCLRRQRASDGTPLQTAHLAAQYLYCSRTCFSATAQLTSYSRRAASPSAVPSWRYCMLLLSLRTRRHALFAASACTARPGFTSRRYAHHTYVFVVVVSRSIGINSCALGQPVAARVVA